jgi:hypothetical protein
LQCRNFTEPSLDVDTFQNHELADIIPVKWIIFIAITNLANLSDAAGAPLFQGKDFSAISVPDRVESNR